MPAAQPAPSGDAAAGLAAFLDGAGLPAAMAARAQQDPEAALRAAGAILRAAVAGMRALLIARADVKREFRIEQTMLRAANNNPLKFAATEEQALAALIDPRTSALPAMQETVDDLTAHQVAALAATQAAARALLARLAPAPLEAEDPGGGLLPGAKERRLWEAYKRRHAQLEEQFEDDFDSAFGKAFARAYEQATGRKDY
jgi:type VI secretion system protein ImpI/type VI secretion system protein